MVNKTKTIIASVLISSILMFGFSVSVYSYTIVPQNVSKFMSLGNKYLEDGKYEEAILEFNKVIKIEAKNIPARIGKSKSYIGKDDTDSAVKLLREAQNLDLKSEPLVLEIIDLLKDINPQEAFEMLQRYLEAIGGENNASEKIKELLQTSLEEPVMPTLDPASGTYIKPVSIKFIADKTRIGHMTYYQLMVMSLQKTHSYI